MSDFDDRGHQKASVSPAEAFKHIFEAANRPGLWETEQDSCLFIRDIMREAMAEQNVSAEQLSTKANVPLEIINAFLEGKGNLRDSEPLTKIQQALRVQLVSW